MISMDIKGKWALWLHIFPEGEYDAYILGRSLQTCYSIFYGIGFINIEAQIAYVQVQRDVE